MKTLFSTFFLLAMLSQISAQDQEENWSWAVHYTSYYAKTVSILDFIQTTGDSFNRPTYSHALGFEVAVPLTSRLFLNTGISFYSTGSKSGTKNLRWGSDLAPNGNWGGPDPNLPRSITTKNQIYYLQVPIHLQYYFTTGKNSIYAKLGGVGEAFTFGRASTEIAYLEKSKTEATGIYTTAPVRKINVLASLGFGMERSLNDKIALFGEIGVRRMIQNIGENRRALSTRSDLGLRLGARMAF